MHWCNVGWFCSSTGVESIFQGSILLWPTNVKIIRNSDICSLAIYPIWVILGNIIQYSQPQFPQLLYYYILLWEDYFEGKSMNMCVHMFLCVEWKLSRNLLEVSAIPTQLRKQDLVERIHFWVRDTGLKLGPIHVYECAFKNVTKFLLKKRQGDSRGGLSRQSNKNVDQTTL